MNTTTTKIAGEAMTDQHIDSIMEQAQVFASAWSLVGGPFDSGGMLETAEQEKAALRALLASKTAVPEGFALVPLILTREMDEVLSDEGWQWEDLLAAAEAITEEQYNQISTAPAQSCGDAEQADDAVTDDVFGWLETEVTAISCRYHGDPSYDHDAYWMRDRVVKLIGEARNVFAARAKDSK
jgi:hypothetical protein